MKYKPKYSNAEELWDQILGEFREIQEHEDNAVSEFAEYLDGWVEAIVGDVLKPLKLTLMLSAPDDRKIRSEYLDLIQIMVSPEDDSLAFIDLGKRFDLWEFLEEDLTMLCDHYDDFDKERAAAVAKRLRALADQIESIEPSEQ
jgi:hypothetical protein